MKIYTIQALIRLILVLLLFHHSPKAQSQSKRILHQTLAVEEAQRLVINLFAQEIDIKETKGSRIFVEIHISLHTPNERLLDYMINSGRYQVIQKTKGQPPVSYLESPKTNQILLVKGEEVLEELRYVIFVPSYLRYTNLSQVSDISRD